MSLFLVLLSKVPAHQNNFHFPFVWPLFDLHPENILIIWWIMVTCTADDPWQAAMDNISSIFFNFRAIKWRKLFYDVWFSCLTQSRTFNPSRTIKIRKKYLRYKYLNLKNIPDFVLIWTLFQYSYNRGPLKNLDISGDFYTLRIQYEYTQTQCEDGARDVRVL